MHTKRTTTYIIYIKHLTEVNVVMVDCSDAVMVTGY